MTVRGYRVGFIRSFSQILAFLYTHTPPNVSTNQGPRRYCAFVPLSPDAFRGNSVSKYVPHKTSQKTNVWA